MSWARWLPAGLFACAEALPARPAAPALDVVVREPSLGPERRGSTQEEVAAATGLQPGDRFVDFGLPRLDLATGELGGLIWLSDYLAGSESENGHLVLLNFFAVWCKPCLDELPVLDAWQQQYGPRGLRVLSVNV